MLNDETVDYDEATSDYIWQRDEDHYVREKNMFNMFVVANKHVSNSDLARKIDHLAYCAADMTIKDIAMSYCRDLRRFVELLEYRVENDIKESDAT